VLCFTRTDLFREDFIVVVGKEEVEESNDSKEQVEDSLGLVAGFGKVSKLPQAFE